LNRRLLSYALSSAVALVATGAMAPITSAQTNTPTTTPVVVTATSTPTPATTSTPVVVTATSTSTPTTPTITATPASCVVPASTTPHDGRWFSQTGYRVDNDTFWDYFNKRGGVNTFGYPSSRTFQFLGFTTQFFQRRVMQLGPNGNAQLLNLFDNGLFPFTTINGSTFPAVDASVQGGVPVPSSPTYSTDVINFIKANAPDNFNGRQVNFFSSFNNQVTLAQAFPNGGGDTTFLQGFDLEMWGAVTSHPSVEPANNNFIYQRWQRGIMMFDGSSGLTQGVLLADYFKAVITGNNIPPDLNSQASSSTFYKQYNNCNTLGINNPTINGATALPGTKLQYAFEPQ